MAVTKQTYSMSAGFTRVDVANALRSALIDAGLMTDWYDSFSPSGSMECRVLRIQHDSTKTYGDSFYYFNITNSDIGVALATNGWKITGTAPINIPTGTQYLDWHTLPASATPSSLSYYSTHLLSYSAVSNFFLDRYTSGDDSKQSWFTFRQPSSLGRSQPFSFLHKDTSLHSWIDLNKGCISGLCFARAAVSIRAGIIRFTIEENLRRCLSFGNSLRGFAELLGSSRFHAASLNLYSYIGVGSQTNSPDNNYPGSFSGTNPGAAIPLPVGRNYVNSEYVTDYVPICTNLPWSYYTPTRLANDFGIYMHYAANDIALGDRFIVQSTINEWEVLNFANNTNVTDGASASFLARII